MRARKVDANHAEIVKTFRQLGCTVLDLSRVGQGCPDVLVGYRGVNLLVEIKDGKKPPSKRLLTPDENEFFCKWKGQVQVVTSQDDAIAMFQTETGRIA